MQDVRGTLRLKDGALINALVRGIEQLKLLDETLNQLAALQFQIDDAASMPGALSRTAHEREKGWERWGRGSGGGEMAGDNVGRLHVSHACLVVDAGADGQKITKSEDRQADVQERRWEGRGDNE